MTGTLYAVGVGPGKPSLITVQAVDALAGCQTVAFPINEAGESLARQAAVKYIKADHVELPMHIPMLGESHDIQQAYQLYSTTIESQLSEGIDVAVLCLGDPLFYGSFIHLNSYINKRFHRFIIPGITSPQLLTALSETPMGVRRQRIAMVNGGDDADFIRLCLDQFDTVVFLKPAKHKNRLLDLIDQAGRSQQCAYGHYLGGEDETVLADFEAIKQQPNHYFSIIIVSRNKTTP